MNKIDKKSVIIISAIIVVVFLIILGSISFINSINNNNNPVTSVPTTKELSSTTIRQSEKETILVTTEIEQDLNSSHASESYVNQETDLPTQSIGLTDQEFSELEQDVIQPYLDSYSGNLQVYLQILNNKQSYSSKNEPLYAASLAKLFVMGAIFEAIESDLIESSESVKHDLEIMITVSDNAAYNRLLYVLQDAIPNTSVFDYVDLFCEKYGFSNTTIHSLLYIDGNEYYRFASDYILETSVEDVGHLLDLIYNNELVSKEASQQMLHFLSMQERTWKIPALLPGEALTANKTGEAETFSHDAAIIVSPACDYVLVIMSDSASANYGSTLADNLIQELSLDIYNFLNR